MVTVYSGNECRQPIEIARSVPNDVLKRNLELLAPRKGFDIEIEVGSFSIGGGLFGPTSTGVIIYHKKYKRKYHSFIVEIKEAYGQTFLYTHFGGRSSNAMGAQMDKTRYSVHGGDVYQHTPGVIGRIYINNQPLLFDNDPIQQYNLLVYTIGTLLSMKYPGNTPTSVGTTHTGSLSDQQSGSQNVDGTYRFVNPKLKKNQ